MLQGCTQFSLFSPCQRLRNGSQETPPRTGTCLDRCPRDALLGPWTSSEGPTSCPKDASTASVGNAPLQRSRGKTISSPLYASFYMPFARGRPKDTQKRMLMATGPCRLLIKEERPQGAVWLVLQQPGNERAQLCKELQGTLLASF